MTPRVRGFTTGFTENGKSERAMFREGDCEFGLGPAELEVPVKNHHRIPIDSGDICVWNRGISSFYDHSWIETRVGGKLLLVEKQAH